MPTDDGIQVSPGFSKRARLSPSRAVVAGLGEDGIHSEDDELFLLDDLGGTPSATPMHAGYVFSGYTNQPLALGEDAVAIQVANIVALRPLLLERRLAVLRDLGPTPSVETIPLPELKVLNWRPRWVAPETLLIPLESETPDGTQEGDVLALVRPFSSPLAIDPLALPFAFGVGSAPVALGNGRGAPSRRQRSTRCRWARTRG